MNISRYFLIGCLATTVAWSESFESPNFHVGDVIEGRSGWTSDGAIITDEQSKEGSQSLKLESGQTASLAGSSSTVEFVDFEVLPSFGGTALSSFKVAGRTLEFVKSEDGGSLVLLSGESDKTPELEIKGFPVDENSNFSTEWIRITARVDAVAGKWDLYVDSRPAASNLSIVASPNVFEASSGMAGLTFIDQWQKSPDNPLFVDSDRDGMPDAEEIALGLNAFGDDRNGDRNGNGISNVNEYFNAASTQVAFAFAGASGVVLFVDNLQGSDVSSGFRSYPAVGGDGPKRSIKGAMEAAPTKALIVVLKGSGVYQEGSRGVAGKALTIKTVGPIVIK